MIGKKLMLESIWWIFTLIVAVLFLLPIYNSMGKSYNYLIPNFAFVIIFITFTRFIFLTNTTLFSEIKWIKLVLVFLPIPLFFYSMDILYDFQRFLDEVGFFEVLETADIEKRKSLANYIRYQFLFFGTGTILVLVLLPIKMIVSIWRQINRR